MAAIRMFVSRLTRCIPLDAGAHNIAIHLDLALHATYELGETLLVGNYPGHRLTALRYDNPLVVEVVHDVEALRLEL